MRLERADLRPERANEPEERYFPLTSLLKYQRSRYKQKYHIFSRVLSDSMTRYVCLSVGQSVGRSVGPSPLTFVIFFYFKAI